MAPKKPTVQTRLQQKAAKSNRILTGPKGSKPQSTTNARLLKQAGGGGKTTMTGPLRPQTRFQNTNSGASAVKKTLALPPGKQGGPLTKVTKALPPGKVGGALAKTAGKLASRVGFVGTALETLRTANSVFNPKSEGNQQLAKAMAAVNKRYSGKSGPRFKNAGTGPSTAKGAKSKAAPMPKGSSAALREKSYASLQKFNVPKLKAAAKPTATKAATTPTRSSAPSRSSAPGRSTTSARTPASRPAAKPAAKPKAPASMASESSMSAADIMKGYGMRVNQTFGAESSPTPKKRESLKAQTDSIKKMIEESKKRQGK